MAILPSLQLLADMGLPMIGLYWPPSWLAFIPIVVIEAWFARRELNLGWSKAIFSSSIANAISTLVGIPLVWFLWATVEIHLFGTALGLDTFAKGIYAVTVQAPWLIPYERHFWWMIPCAAGTLTAVFCVASIAVEWLVMRLMHPSADRRALRRWAWMGNACSYAVLFAFVYAFLWLPRGTLDQIAQQPVEFVIDLAWRAAVGGEW